MFGNIDGITETNRFSDEECNQMQHRKMRTDTREICHILSLNYPQFQAKQKSVQPYTIAFEPINGSIGKDNGVFCNCVCLHVTPDCC